jgi:hypothetical protein
MLPLPLLRRSRPPKKLTQILQLRRRLPTLLLLQPRRLTQRLLLLPLRLLLPQIPLPRLQ